MNLINKSEYEELQLSFEKINNKDDDFIKNVLFKIILNYCKENNLIIYGGYAIQENLKLKQNIIHIKDTEDLDVYSVDPIKMGNDLFKIFIKRSDVYKCRFVNAKHPGTFTLSVNDKKILDISYLEKEIYDKIGYNKNFNSLIKSNIKIITPYIIYIDFLNSLTDNESAFRSEKTFNKLNNLLTFYPIKDPESIKSLDDVFINININYKVNFINKIKDLLNYLIEKTNNLEVVNKSLNENEYRIQKKGETSLTAFKYKKFKNDFLINGILAYYLLINNLIRDNKIKNFCNFKLENIFELDLYTTNNNIYKNFIEDFLNVNNIKFEINKEVSWFNLNYNNISFKLENGFIIYLFEVEKNKQYFKEKSFLNGKELKISPKFFCMSHLLFKSNIINKKNNILYNKMVFRLSNVLNKFDDYIGLSYSNKDINEQFLKLSSVYDLNNNKILIKKDENKELINKNEKDNLIEKDNFINILKSIDEFSE